MRVSTASNLILVFAVLTAFQELQLSRLYLYYGKTEC